MLCCYKHSGSRWLWRRGSSVLLLNVFFLWFTVNQLTGCAAKGGIVVCVVSKHLSQQQVFVVSVLL